MILIWKADSVSRRSGRLLRDERGSSLLLVVFLILLLSMIGVAVLGAALGGAMRTERSEESVQSLHLAQKGLDEAIAAIYERFNNRTIDPDELGSQLTSFTRSFNEQLKEDRRAGGSQRGASELSAAARPFYQVLSVRCTHEQAGTCLPPGLNSGNSAINSSINNNINSSDAANYQYSLTVTAEAEVDGAKRRLQQTIVLDTYPDFLKYAFGTEGLLTVNGAPYFMGNLYAGQGLRMSDTAEYIYNSAARTQKSQFMFLGAKKDAAGTGRLITGAPDNMKYGYGQTYRDEGQLPLPYEPAYDKKLGEAILAPEKENTHHLAEVIDPMPPQKFVSIDVLSSFLDKVRDSLGNAAADPKGARTVIQNVYAQAQAPGLMLALKTRPDFSRAYEQLGSMPVLREEPQLPDILLNQPSSPAPGAPEGGAVSPEDGSPDTAAPPSPEYEAALAQYQSDLLTYETEKAAYQLRIDKLGATLASLGKAAGSAMFDGPLVLGPALKKIDFHTKGRGNWLIVNGDLILRGSKDDAADRLMLRGNLLVTGNVEISGQVDVDATILALGRTDIRDAAIRGLKLSPDSSKKELVLIGLGPIDLYRVDSFQVLDEQGYTSSSERERQVLDAFLYTDSSASLYGVGSAFWMNGGFFAKKNLTLNATLGFTREKAADNRLEFDDQLLLRQQHARFIIEYNDQVFAHQNVALPRVNKVRMTTGPLKLL